METMRRAEAEPGAGALPPARAPMRLVHGGGPLEDPVGAQEVAALGGLLREAMVRPPGEATVRRAVARIADAVTDGTGVAREAVR